MRKPKAITYLFPFLKFMPQEKKNGNCKDRYVNKFGCGSHFTTYKFHAVHLKYI